MNLPDEFQMTKTHILNALLRCAGDTDTNSDYSCNCPLALAISDILPADKRVLVTRDQSVIGNFICVEFKDPGDDWKFAGDLIVLNHHEGVTQLVKKFDEGEPIRPRTLQIVNNRFLQVKEG